MGAITLTTIFISATAQFGLPSGLLESVCWVESTHNPNAIHRDDGGSDSIGLCQIKLETAQWLGFKGRKKDLFKPEVNAHYAAKYLAYQIKRYNGNTKKAVIAYNIGNAKGLTQTSYSDKVYAYWGNKNVHSLQPVQKHIIQPVEVSVRNLRKQTIAIRD